MPLECTRTMNSMYPAAQTAFVGALCWHVPELLPTMQAHLDTYEELLPHVLMGDVTRWIVEKFCENPEDELLKKTLEFMEKSFSQGSYDTQEIITVSFLENLPSPGEDGFEVRSLLGRSLQDELNPLR